MMKWYPLQSKIQTQFSKNVKYHQQLYQTKNIYHQKPSGGCCITFIYSTVFAQFSLKQTFAFIVIFFVQIHAKKGPSHVFVTISNIIKIFTRKHHENHM